jgi:hypothetical protein
MCGKGSSSCSADGKSGGMSSFAKQHHKHYFTAFWNDGAVDSFVAYLFILDCHGIPKSL